MLLPFGAGSLVDVLQEFRAQDLAALGRRQASCRGLVDAGILLGVYVVGEPLQGIDLAVQLLLSRSALEARELGHLLADLLAEIPFKRRESFIAVSNGVDGSVFVFSVADVRSKQRSWADGRSFAFPGSFYWVSGLVRPGN